MFQAAQTDYQILLLVCLSGACCKACLGDQQRWLGRSTDYVGSRSSERHAFQGGILLTTELAGLHTHRFAGTVTPATLLPHSPLFRLFIL